MPSLPRMRPRWGSNGSSIMTTMPYLEPESRDLPAEMAEFGHLPSACLLSPAPCLAKNRCADKDLRHVARHCLYLVFPAPLSKPLPDARRQPEHDACPAPHPGLNDHADHASANALRASSARRKACLPVMSCAFPSPSTIITATNHAPFSRPRIRTRSSSSPSPSALS